MENMETIRELAKINNEKTRDEICRIVIRRFNEAKNEFVATYCGPNKALKFYEDAMDNLVADFEERAKKSILTDCPFQNETFELIADGGMSIDGAILYLMTCFLIPIPVQDVLCADHDFNKCFFVAYGWQTLVCHQSFDELAIADEKFNWNIVHLIAKEIEKRVFENSNTTQPS